MTRSWSLALLLSLIVPLSGRTARQGNPVLAFVGVAVIPMDRERVLENRTVVVQGQTIIALGPADQTPVPANAVQVDGHGKYLLPGLADMHAHLLMAKMEGGVLGGGAPAEDSVAMERMLFLLAANGVTTIRNMDYQGVGPGEHHSGRFGFDYLPYATAGLLRWRARVAAGELWAPRIYTAGAWFVDTLRSVDENVNAYKAAGYDFIKP